MQKVFPISILDGEQLQCRQNWSNLIYHWPGNQVYVYCYDIKSPFQYDRVWPSTRSARGDCVIRSLYSCMLDRRWHWHWEYYERFSWAVIAPFAESYRFHCHDSHNMYRFLKSLQILRRGWKNNCYLMLFITFKWNYAACQMNFRSD